MRRGLLAALAAAVLVLSGCGSGGVSTTSSSRVAVDTPQLRALKKQAGVENCRPGTGSPVSGGLPQVTLPCLGGGPDVDLATLRGPLVISVWASWCGPCRQEMPVLEAFHQKYAGKVGVLGVDYQDPQTAAALTFVQHTGATYPLLADTEGALDRAAPLPHLAGLPFLVLVGADGKVAFQEFTVLDSEQQLADLVHEHLGVGL